jgi:N-acetylmuramoyl-L-alanine amidase
MKKAIAIGGTTLMLSGMISVPQNINAETKESIDIIIRAAEYPNKPGKRLDNVNEDFNIGVPLRYENGRYCIQEYDLNKKVSLALVEYLKEKNVNVVFQDTENKSQDLNAAGRLAKTKNSKIYLSIHHNSYASDSTGYFFMTNGDTESSQYAKRLSNAMSNNPMLIPQRDNQINSGYIGELNQKPARINILAELGFALSNPDEAKKCASIEQVDYIAKSLGDEIIKILNELR